MRHGKKDNHLGRTHSHRNALLQNLTISLIKAKRIETTLAKAKELRKYVEPLITKAKNDTTHSRRIVFSYLQDKESIKTLFGEIAEKVASRNGGYTRIIKLGTRIGDNAEVAIIELVDFNESLITTAEETTARTRRSRRGAKSTTKAETPSAEVVEEAAPAVEEAPAIETPAADESTSSEEETNA